MMSLTRNFLFIHVPKTGGSSIQKAVLPFSDSKLVSYHPEDTPFEDIELFEIHNLSSGLLPKHSTYDRIRIVLGPETVDPLFKATVTRNPWERIVSYLCGAHWDAPERFFTEEGFLDFIASDFVQPLERYIPFDKVDQFIRFDHLEEDFQVFCRAIDIAPPPLEHLLKSERQPYPTYYTDRTREAVATRFAQEIERFGYTFDSAEPTSLEAPAPGPASCSWHP